MSDAPIDFEAVREQRSLAAIDADQAHWEVICDQLTNIMMTAEMSDHSLTSATLRALLDVLVAGNEGDLEAAKRFVAGSLNGFFMYKNRK